MGGKETFNKKEHDTETTTVQSVAWWPGRPDKTGKFVHQVPPLFQPHRPPVANLQYTGYNDILGPSHKLNIPITHYNAPVTDHGWRQYQTLPLTPNQILGILTAYRCREHTMRTTRCKWRI